MKKGFTLIEIVITTLLLSFILSVILTLNVKYKKNEYSSFLLKIKDKISPYGFFVVLKNGNIVIIKNKKFLFEGNNNKAVQVTDKFFDNVNDIKFYQYTKIGWKEKNFGYYNNQKIIFLYQVYKNLNNIHGILKFKNEFYVIKPFEIKKFDNLEKAKNYYFLMEYQPYKGIN